MAQCEVIVQNFPDQPDSTQAYLATLIDDQQLTLTQTASDATTAYNNVITLYEQTSFNTVVSETTPMLNDNPITFGFLTVYNYPYQLDSLKTYRAVLTDWSGNTVMSDSDSASTASSMATTLYNQTYLANPVSDTYIIIS